MAGEWDAFPVARVDIPPAGRALLDTIAGSEAAQGYNTLYRGGQFDSFADHPRQAIPIIAGPNAGKTSSAAGRYQFLGSTWDQVKNDLQLPDFSPESQDQGAWHLANTTYAKKTGGRDLAADLEAAKGNPGAVNMIGSYLSGTWTSLPNGIEPNKASGSFGTRYAANMKGGTQSDWDAFPMAEAPAAPTGGGQFAAPLPDGGNFRTAREGISPPDPGLMDKLTERLTELWDNPPKDKLSFVGMVKKAYEGVTLPGDVASGKVQVRGEDGYTNPEVIERSANLAGAVPLRSAPGGIFAAPIGKGLPVRTPPPEAVTPTIQELKTAAKAGYQSPEVTDLAIKPNTLTEFAQATKTALNKEGYDETPAVAKGTFAILDKIEKAPEGAVVTGQNLLSLKKTFGNAAKEVGADGQPTANAAAAKQAMKAVDEFMGNIAEKDIISGSPASALSTLKTANANYSAAKTAEGIDRKVIQAENRAAATHSGQNVANTVRQRLATVMNGPEFARFKPDEQAMIRQIVQGTPTANAVRFVGKLLGGGGGLGAITSATIGGYATGGPGAVAPVIGFALNALSNRMTLNQAAKLSEAIRSRAPLANAMNDFGAKAVEFQTAQTPRSVSAAMIAARNLSSNLKDAGITMSPADIMRSLVGPMKSAADQDQQN